MVRARLSADAELMQRILSSEGFYDGRVDTRIDRTPVASEATKEAGDTEGRRRGRRGPVVAVIDVTPGQRYSFASIDIQADPTVPPTLIEDNFPLAVGEPNVAQRVQGARLAERRAGKGGDRR